MYPARTEEIDYNRFSPYTPIQYYVDETTKYQNYHIDLVNYTNENHLNLNTYYYRNYHDSYDRSGQNNRNLNWHYPDFSRFWPSSHGESHGHGHGHHEQGHHAAHGHGH